MNTLCVATIVHDTAAQVVVPAGTVLEICDDATVGSVTLTLVVERDATVHYRGVFVVDSGLIERTILARCEGVGSTADLQIACHTLKNGQFAVSTQQHHAASHSSSRAKIVGVSEQVSRASVTSTIFIAKNIQAVAAQQEHKHLLLDVGARATSVPALDVLSNDVACSHGSAITYFDPAQLFYLMARGYSPDEARDAMIRAFLTL